MDAKVEYWKKNADKFLSVNSFNKENGRIIKAELTILLIHRIYDIFNQNVKDGFGQFLYRPCFTSSYICLAKRLSLLPPPILAEVDINPNGLSRCLLRFYLGFAAHVSSIIMYIHIIIFRVLFNSTIV
jgi:hypothetical protein